MSDTLYIVMPAYNEEGSIRDVVTSWYPKLSLSDGDARLVIADSGSSDATHAILKELQAEYPQLLILEDTLKQHGPKLIALYRYAIDHGADYIFQTDSDGQTEPGEFDRFWNSRKKYDALIGNRTERGDGKARDFVEKVVCLLLRAFFGVRVPDANAPFRLMRAQLVDKYLGRMSEDYNLPNIMLTTWFAYYRENITFGKITFKPRQTGVNSVNIPRIVGIGWQALKDFRRFRKDM